jgi:hypothetical protein
VGVNLQIIPLTLREAQEFVQRHHRHNKPPHGCKFAIGARVAGALVGVATVGRPVSREIQTREPLTVEVNRTCTDGTRNANSKLYGAAWRASKAMGYTRSITYTRADEDGASLRAAGYVKVKEIPARPDWKASSVQDKGLRDPAQQTFIEDDRRNTGNVARVLWEIRR